VLNFGEKLRTVMTGVVSVSTWRGPPKHRCFRCKHGGPGEETPNHTSDRGGPQPARHTEERACADPGSRGVDPVVSAGPARSDGGLGADEEHRDHACAVAVGAAHGAAVVEDAVDAHLGGLAR
jgi:hypothetical protein